MANNNLTTERQTEIETRVTALETSLALAYAAFDEALASGGIESFKFDSGDASQWAKYHTPQNLLKTIDQLEARIDYWNRKLNNKANTILALRRKLGTSYGGPL